MNPPVGAEEAEEVRRPLSVFKRFYNFLYSVLVTFYTLLLEPVFALLAILIPRGARRLLFGPLIQWPPIHGSERVPSHYNGRVKSKNLVTKCIIGKGCSGIFYETTWLGCSQGSSHRLARKDFPGVKGDIFEREIIPLFELPDHPNLLKTLCWTVDNRSCSLVMEYMRDDLSSVVRRKKEELRKKQANQPGMGPVAPFELHEALEIAIQIAIGLEYLHLTGITHGDLKPNNIFIDWKGDMMVVKLADFGLLKTKRRSTMVSQRAFCFQMMEWSAPELFEDYLRSASEDLDYLWTKLPIGLETSTSSVSTFEKYSEISMTQADSYSFALLFAFVLGGQMWNAKLSPSELRREISISGLRPKLPSGCPETLRSLISLCWDANPTRRPTFSYILKELLEEQRNLMGGKMLTTRLKKIGGTGHALPSYLNIDLSTVKFSNPIHPYRGMRQLVPVRGSALVYFGNWLGCDYAVKVFTGVDRSEYFMDVETLSKLHHPNIVQLVGFGQDEEKCLILMGLMDTDLRTFMRSLLTQRDRPFSRSQELDIITQIAKGLYYLHEQRFSHGDLKCSRILVKQMGDHIDVKLADFRLSEKLGTGDPMSFEEIRQYRRPRWSAPEIYAYGEVEPTPELLKKIDVYSFGMVCYEVVTGKYPFSNLRDDALQEQIAIGDLRQDLPSELNDDLRKLIESCWERDPNARPTLDMICHRLDFIMSSQPVTNTRFENAIALRPSESISLAGTLFAEYLPDDDGLHEKYANAPLVPDFVEVNPANLKLLRQLSRGPFGDVYEGTWLWSSVAVKRFPYGFEDKLNFFMKLRHPFIVQFMGLSIRPTCLLVMELMGGNLRQLIEFRKKQKTTSGSRLSQPKTVHLMPFDLHEAVYIMRRIALATAFLHFKGVAHRNLKSSNILVTTHAGSIDVKITGFGVAELIDFREEPTGLAGTTRWMAPEIMDLIYYEVKLVGDDEPCDLKAADVYSFAMTCYEILTGQLPLEDQEFVPRRELRLALIKGLRPTLPSAELISADLRRLIEQCWDQQPKNRPTFSYICTELQRIQQAMTSERNLDDEVRKH